MDLAKRFVEFCAKSIDPSRGHWYTITLPPLAGHAVIQQVFDHPPSIQGSDFVNHHGVLVMVNAVVAGSSFWLASRSRSWPVLVCPHWQHLPQLHSAHKCESPTASSNV